MPAVHAGLAFIVASALAAALVAVGARFRGLLRLPVGPRLRLPVDFLLGSWVLAVIVLLLGIAHWWFRGGLVGAAGGHTLRTCSRRALRWRNCSRQHRLRWGSIVCRRCCTGGASWPQARRRAGWRAPWARRRGRRAVRPSAFRCCRPRRLLPGCRPPGGGGWGGGCA